MLYIVVITDVTLNMSVLNLSMLLRSRLLLLDRLAMTESCKKRAL